MLLAYVLIFVLHLTASTCDGTGRNDHLLFAGRADDATAPSPAIHHHHRYTGNVLSDYQNMHFHPAMMAPRPSPSVEAAGIGGASPPSSFAVEPSGVEGAPPPPQKQDIISRTSPRGNGASSEASATEQEESASDDVGVDYAGPKTHPPHGPPRPAESIH